jgi:hypothetical protein
MCCRVPERPSIASTTRVYWARTEAVSGWSKMVRTVVATHGCADLGTLVNRFLR